MMNRKLKIASYSFCAVSVLSAIVLTASQGVFNQDSSSPVPVYGSVSKGDSIACKCTSEVLPTEGGAKSLRSVKPIKSYAVRKAAAGSDCAALNQEVRSKYRPLKIVKSCVQVSQADAIELAQAYSTRLKEVKRAPAGSNLARQRK